MMIILDRLVIRSLNELLKGKILNLFFSLSNFVAFIVHIIFIHRMKFGLKIITCKEDITAKLFNFFLLSPCLPV